MSKYDRLGIYLRGQRRMEVPMSFAEIERVVGAKLPKSQEYQAWWSNSTSNNVMTKVWLDAGYRTERVDTAAKKLVFRRLAEESRDAQSARQARGVSDVEQEFRNISAVEKKLHRSPLWGALKGTFTIEPGWDLGKPALDAEELTEMDANLDRTADMIEKGLAGR